MILGYPRYQQLMKTSTRYHNHMKRFIRTKRTHDKRWLPEEIKRSCQVDGLLN